MCKKSFFLFPNLKAVEKIKIKWNFKKILNKLIIIKKKLKISS